VVKLYKFRASSQNRTVKLYTVHTVHFYSITNFLNQQIHTSYLLYNTIFTVKSVKHISVPYFGTIIRDQYRELHKITNQKIMVLQVVNKENEAFVVHMDKGEVL
jgi:hypothetical protein